MKKMSTNEYGAECKRPFVPRLCAKIPLHLKQKQPWQKPRLFLWHQPGDGSVIDDCD